MLAQKFGHAVSWCLSPEKMTQTWDRVLGRLFPDAVRPHTPVEQQKRRAEFIHDQAARAVEWNRDDTERRYEFIKVENQAGRNPWGVTPDEIFQYSQTHYEELLPKRGFSPEEQAEMERLRVGQPATPGLN